MVIELKSASEVRAHARAVQKRINQRRASATTTPEPRPRPAKSVAPSVVAPPQHVDDVPEEALDAHDLPLHAASGVPGYPTRTVLTIAAEYFGFTLRHLIGDWRTSALILPRHVAYFVARRLGASYPKIGRAARRGHSTIHHGCRAIEDRIRTDDTIAVAVDVIGTKVAAAFGVRWRPVKRADQRSARRGR